MMCRFYRWGVLQALLFLLCEWQTKCAISAETERAVKGTDQLGQSDLQKTELPFGDPSEGLAVRLSTNEESDYKRPEKSI